MSDATPIQQRPKRNDLSSRARSALLHATLPRLGSTMAVFALALAEWSPSSNAFDWQAGRDFRTAQLQDSKSGTSGFNRLKPSATGITFSNHLAHNTSAQNQIRL